MDSAKRYVVVQRWMEKNEERILRASGVKNPEEEGSSAKGEAFARLMVATIERHFDSEFSLANLDAAFALLVSRGLLSSAEQPLPPAPKPKLYYLELRSPGAETKTKGPLLADDAIARARFYGREQTAVTIRDEQGEALDMDLQPLIDNPLHALQPWQKAQPQTPPQANLETEYAEFYAKNRTDRIRRRAAADAGFRQWLSRSGQLEYQKASSGGVDREGRAVEPVRL